MTQKEIKLIKHSWETIRPLSAQFAEIFYYRLFEVAPQVRSMFKGSMFSQQQKFVGMIDLIVLHINNLEMISPDLDASAERHVGYGVQSGHFVIVEKVLMATFAQAMQDVWNHELEIAWIKAYNMVADKIRDSFHKH